MLVKKRTFSGTVVNIWNSLVDDGGVVVEVVVEFAFVDELGVVGICGLDLNCDFEVGFGVDGLVDLSEGSLINFADDLEVLADFLKHLGHSLSLTHL